MTAFPKSTNELTFAGIDEAARREWERAVRERDAKKQAEEKPNE